MGEEQHGDDGEVMVCKRMSIVNKNKYDDKAVGGDLELESLLEIGTDRG